MRNSLKKFREFFRLSLSDKLILIKAFVVIALIRTGLKFFSFQNFKKFYNKSIEKHAGVNLPLIVVERHIWAVNTISPRISAQCLPQALALKYLLRKDKSIKLIIGINHNKGLAAHAWIEKDNKILLGEFISGEFQKIWTWD